MPVQVGKTLYITAEITGQEGRKIYCRAEGRIGGVDGAIAIEAAAIFITVPLEHFIDNAPENYRANLFGSAAPELEINP
jgi:predicted thioesterase